MTRKRSWLISWFSWALVSAIAIAAMADMGFLEPARFAKGLVNTGVFTREMFPPALGVLTTLSQAMLETLQIAFVGTLLGFVMSLPLAFLASRNLFGLSITWPVRVLLSIVRTVPSLLWAVVFVVAFGLGPMAGTFGVAFYTLGYLGKLFYEAFEGVDGEVIEAVKSVGCNRLQLMRYAVLPEAANHILSQLLFMFEYNVRASAIVGFVGAGGIGFYMLGYLQLLQYQNLMTALLLTLAVVLLIDQASTRIRGLVLPSFKPGSA